MEVELKISINLCVVPRYIHGTKIMLRYSKILAYEYNDMIQAAESGGQPEVGPEEGMEAIALAYALFESGVKGEPVNVKDITDGSISSYQDEIDNRMGI